jgi:hypothetical protein
MKTIITYLLMMTFFGGFVSAQEKKSKSKKPSARQGSVYSYKFVPRSSTGDPLIFTMPVDTTRAANVKIPNSYRKGNTEPVPILRIRSNWLDLRRCAIHQIQVMFHRLKLGISVKVVLPHFWW